MTLTDEVVNSPYGETKYYNYDPDQIEDIDDAKEFFEWLAELNTDKGNGREAAVYRDCAEFLERELMD